MKLYSDWLPLTMFRGGPSITRQSMYFARCNSVRIFWSIGRIQDIFWRGKCWNFIGNRGISRLQFRVTIVEFWMRSRYRLAREMLNFNWESRYFAPTIPCDYCEVLDAFKISFAERNVGIYLCRYVFLSRYQGWLVIYSQYKTQELRIKEKLLET